MIGGQLRHRPGRATALFAGVLVATTGFIVLMGSVETSRLQVDREVDARFRSAYDILVRPIGTKAKIEAEQGLVRPNYLSGQVGGVTLEQWQRIRRIDGVEIAAPIANLGFLSTHFYDMLDLTSYVDRSLTSQLIRLQPTWIADRGLTRAPDAPMYVYVTKNRLYRWGPETYEDGTKIPDEAVCRGPLELLPDGRKLPVCGTLDRMQPGLGEEVRTWFHSYQLLADGTFAHSTATHIGTIPPTPRLRVPIQYWTSVGVAAIDPESEARLVGLDQTVVKGRFLRAADAMGTKTDEGFTYRTMPVLAATKLYDDEEFSIAVSRLSGTSASAVVSERHEALRTRLKADPGAPLDTIERRIPERPFDFDRPGPLPWSSLLMAGPPGYSDGSGGVLRPEPAEPAPLQIWTRGIIYMLGSNSPPVFAADTPMRALETLLEPTEPIQSEHIGDFDPTRLAGFSAASEVPMETYRAPVAVGADPRSSKLLGGQELRPNSNLQGYLVQPPLVLTTLAAAGELLQQTRFYNTPISAVRVRVSDVRHLDELTRERIRVIAERITLETGLEVDITVGSSPSAQTVVLPAGKFGRPELTLTEGWSRKGVAVAIIQAIDRKSVILFGLILAVCLLFLGNALMAAVSARRRELGVLACLGWPPAKLARLIVVEVGGLGLAAGVVSALVSWPLARSVGVIVGTAHLLAAIPVAFGLSMAAAAVPAWRASRAAPAVAVAAYGVSSYSGRRTSRTRTISGLAARNCLRQRGRSVIGVLAMAVGTAALTVIAALQLAFHGQLTGSLLGEVVSLKVRGVDTVAVIATVLLGAAAVGDVLYLNLRERTPELAALRASGWDDLAVGRLVAYEGVLLGATGAVLGAGLGLLAVQGLSGSIGPELLRATMLAALAGTAVAAAAALVPALLSQRLPLPQLLAEE